MLSEHQIKIADLYNIPIGNVKKLLPNLFDEEKYVIQYENLKLYQIRIETKKNIPYQNSINYNGKNHILNSTQKKEQKQKKIMIKMKKCLHGKTMENIRNTINVKLVNNEKYYLKCTSKPS